MPTGILISYLKATKLVSKRNFFYLVKINDSSVEILSIQSIPVVKEFPEIFPHNLLGFPCEREIDFNIKVFLDTRPGSIFPYRMEATEFEGLKEKLKDLLDKDFFDHLYHVGALWPYL